MKVFLAPEIRKSVLEELAFTKSVFLGLVNFGFLDLANFVTVYRFSKFLLTSLLLTLAVPLGTF